MRLVEKILNYIGSNKEWIFSGIGITIISLLFTLIVNKISSNKLDNFNIVNSFNQDNGKYLEIHGDVDGDVYQDSVINNTFITNEKINDNANLKEIENVEKFKEVNNKTSIFQEIMDSESNKHWSEKHIIGIPYEPDSDVLKRINDATDYTNDWDAYEPLLFYHNEDTGLENIGLVGKTENFLLYDISINDGSMLIKTSEDSYVLAEGILSTSSTGGSPQPSIMEADYDNDGDNELAIRVYLLHGTGVSIESLFMVDKASDGNWYMFQFLYKDYFDELYKKYTSKVKDDNLYFVWNDNVIEIPQKLKNIEHFNYYCVGEIVNIEYWSEEIVIKLGVGYNINAYWDYSSGHGILAKVHYQGDGKWELAEYDYYNDLLEDYVTGIMDLYLTGNVEQISQECNFTFPTLDHVVTEYDIVKIVYDSSKFGSDTFRVDVMYTVNNVGTTFHAILTIKQVDSSDSFDIMSYGLWKICDFMITA